MKLRVEWFELAESNGPVEGGFGQKLPFLWYWYTSEMWRDLEGIYTAEGECRSGHALTMKAAARRMEQAMNELDDLVEKRFGESNTMPGNNDPRGN